MDTDWPSRKNVQKFRQRKHVHGDQRESQQQGVDVVGCVAGVCPVADGRVATEARRGEAVVDVAGADAETRRKPRLPHSLVASSLRFIGAGSEDQAYS